jgi:small subunit ribosomal protein S5
MGDRNGTVGLGYAKANEVPPAIEKAQKDAKKNLKRVQLQRGTIPHAVIGRHLSSTVTLIPASPGTGVVAGATVRAVLEAAGVTDCMTKSTGSNNQKNLAKAVLNGLQQLRSKEAIAALRGVDIDSTEVDEKLERGSAFMPSSASSAEKLKGPVNRVDEERRQQRGRGGRGGDRGGRGRRPDNRDSAPTGDSANSASEASTEKPNSDS